MSTDRAFGSISFIVRLEKVTEAPDIERVRGYLNLLTGVRDAARKEKRFDLADLIRNKLAEEGIFAEDTPHGTVWKQKR